MTAGERWKTAQALIEQRAVRSSEQRAEALVKYLNYDDGHVKDDDNSLLRVFVETWIKCGYDPHEWEWCSYFNKLVRDLPFRLIRTEAGVRLDADLEVALFSMSNLSLEESYERYCDRVATKTFLLFVQGPWFDKIAQCRKCSRFLLKTRTDRVFCSAECARSASSLNAHRKHRGEQHQTKLLKVQRALAKFEKLSSETKEHILRKRRGRTAWLASKTGFSPKFVTLALREVGGSNGCV